MAAPDTIFNFRRAFLTQEISDEACRPPSQSTCFGSTEM